MTLGSSNCTQTSCENLQEGLPIFYTNLATMQHSPLLFFSSFYLHNKSSREAGNGLHWQRVCLKRTEQQTDSLCAQQHTVTTMQLRAVSWVEINVVEA